MNEAQLRIQIRENSKKAVTKIKKNFAKVDKSRLRANLSIDDSSIEETRGKLQVLSKGRKVTLETELDKTSLAKTEAQLQGLNANKASLRGTRSATRGPIDGSGLDITNADIRKAEIKNAVTGDEWTKGKNGQFSQPGYFGSKPGDRRGLKMQSNIDADKINERENRIQELLSKPELGPSQATGSDGKRGDKGLFLKGAVDQSTSRGFQKRMRPGSGTTVGGLSTKNIKGTKQKAQKTKKAVKGVSKSVNGLRSTFRKMTPSMNTWYRLLAASIPILAGLAVHALAAASAFTALAGAGAIMVGAGLFSGETIGDGAANAERKINSLKRSLFEAFQPVLEIFEPISTEFLDMMPQRIQPLVDALKGIDVFEKGFIRMFEGGIQWAADVINSAQKYADVLESLVMNYGSELGEHLGNFMVFLIETATKNEEALFDLIDALAALGNILWQAFKVGIYLISVFKPILMLVSKIASLLNNKFILALAVAAATFWVVVSAVTSATTALSAFTGVMAVFSGASLMKTLGGIAGIFTFLTGKIWSAIVAMGTFKAITGGVAALLAGGFALSMLKQERADATGASSNRNATSKHTHNTEINVYGEDATKAGDRLEERFPDMYEQEVDRRDTRGY